MAQERERGGNNTVVLRERVRTGESYGLRMEKRVQQKHVFRIDWRADIMTFQVHFNIFLFNMNVRGRISNCKTAYTFFIGLIIGSTSYFRN